MKIRYIILFAILAPFITIIAVLLGLGYILLCIFQVLLSPFVKQKISEQPQGLAGLLLNLIPNENVRKREKLSHDSERGSALKSV